MAREVRLTHTGPLKVDLTTLPPEKAIWICQCGLSQKYPFCDGSHKPTVAEEPGCVYVYSKDRKTVVEKRVEPQ